MTFLSSRARDRIKSLIPNNITTRRLPAAQSECVLLTFDDGPHPKITPQVLKLLETYEARALFFIVGHRVSKAPQVLKMICDQGHVIGNHTYIHSNDKQPFFFDYWRDLKQCQILIEKVSGHKPKTFRPPGGRISFTSLIIPRLLGMKIVLSSLDVHDWRCQMVSEAEMKAGYIIKNIVPGDILSLHDDNPYVLKILNVILPFMKSRNFDLRSGINSLMWS